MPQSDILTNGRLVDKMRYAIMEGEKNVKHIPSFVKQVIETEAWKKRWVRSYPVTHETFLGFINADPLDGMGWSSAEDKAMVASLLREDPDVLGEWHRLTTPPHGGDRKSEEFKDKIKRDNVPLDHRGNSRARALDRLQRKRPDLFKRVVAKELSANAAAIEAGWRKKATPLDLLRKAWNAATPDEQRTFLKEIGKC